MFLTPTTILVIAAIKSIQHSAPEWDKSVSEWIKQDEKSFLKFKKNVFDTIAKNKHVLGCDGYEKI